MKRKIQLISSILLLYTLLSLVGIVFSQKGDRPFLLASAIISFLLYFPSRTRFYQTAIYMAVVLINLSQFWLIFSARSYITVELEGLIVRMVVVFLFGIALLSWRENIFLISVNLVLIGLLPLVVDWISPTSTYTALGFLLTCAAIIVASIRVRELMEADRRHEILEAEQFLREIINGLPGIFFMYDEDNRLVRWNKKYEEVTQFTAGEIEELHISDLVQPAYRERMDLLTRLSRKNNRAEAEILFITKNGHSVPFYVKTILNTLNSGDYVIGFGVDVTSFKHVEEAQRAVVEHSLQGLAIYQKGRIVFANPAYAQTLGYSIEELAQMNSEQVRNLVFIEDQPTLTARMNLAFSGGEIPPRYETRFVRKDGTIRWLDVTMSVINYRDELAVQTASIDITDRKQMEVEQARLIWELEAKNAELERFTYTVSHDLKSPLITIRGYLGFLEKDIFMNNPARLKADMQRITEATDKMQKLLADLLALSRVGRVTNPPEYVPFEVIAQDAVERVGGQLRKRNVQIRIDTPLPTLYVDRERVVEVVQNLVDNAVKFMGSQSSPRIEIGTRGVDENGFATLFVKDNGIGIEAQFLDRIFGLFNKLNPESEGTGVGLALVKRIIEYQGGKIWVESTPLLGSTFVFTLPTTLQGSIS